jgi:BlaI family transcriptional regulator, penicillinase repressor
MKEPRLSKAETRILEQYWKLGTASVREVLESLPEDERVAYTTVQTLVYRLEEKGALKKVKKIGNAQLFQPALDRSQYRSRLVSDMLDLFGGSPRLLVSNLLENGALTLRDLKTLQGAAPGDKNGHSRCQTCMSILHKRCTISASIYYSRLLSALWRGC